MAIYHFSAKVIGRSSGRSAIASAAYRSASVLRDDRLGREHDYTAKAGVVHSEVLLPDGAPERWRDRGTLWNEVEAVERQRNAQLARDIEISLPRELSRAEVIGLAREYVAEQFVDRGMVADLNVHWTRAADGELQPHAHVMLSLRRVEAGRGPEGREAEAGFGLKERGWNDRALLCGWRERWAEMANQRLCALGHDVRIDHRSLRDQGIDLEPQHKIGPAGARREDRGEEAERSAEHRAIARRNGERLLAHPAIALKALTQQHSTFTRHDLARFVDRHTDGAEQFAQVMAKVEAAPELVRLGVDGRGRERFSTREMLEAERRMEGAAGALAGRDRHRVLLTAGWRALRAAEAAGLALGEEQRAAYRHVTSGQDLAVVVGYAGTGKSALLGVARAAWEAAGYRVRGAALSGIAAEGLEAGSEIGSRTLASLEHGWARGWGELGPRDVLVIDEAGMIGSRQLGRVLGAAEAAGAKVVLVGDPEQLQAIEAGAAFRAVAERAGWAEITAVRRQHAEWQREATRELATGRTGAALGRYAAAGMVREAATREAAKAALVDGWAAARRAHPGESQVMLAYTRDDVADLNQLARARMRDAGALHGTDRVVQTERGARAFAAGDRVMFLRNERGLGGWEGRAGVAVKNGSLGTVLAVEAGGNRLTVRLDGAGPEKGGGRAVTFNVRDYGHIDHGYAATVHKAQGVTVDRAHVLATPHLDRHAAYVGLTRHRAEVALHYASEDFATSERLARVLGRERAKDTTLDYDPEREAALVRRYGARRGVDPLRPDSEIVVPNEIALRPERGRVPADEAAPAPSLVLGGNASEARPRPEDRADRGVPGPDGFAEQPRPGRRVGRFAGLRLGAGLAAERGPEERAERPPAAREPRRPSSGPALAPSVPVVEPTRGAGALARPKRVSRGLADYARAWEDAARMGRAGLPVLAHQAAALARAGEALGPELARDARAALERAPGLGQRAGTWEGLATLEAAIGAERQARLALEARAHEAVRAWQQLERAYAKAERGYDGEARREVGGRLEAFAKELKRDAQLDSLLRQRGRELGVGEGSRLERVVQARDEDLSRTLRRELDLGRGHGLGMGM